MVVCRSRVLRATRTVREQRRGLAPRGSDVLQPASSIAEIAQLGEQQTEVLEVACSIHALGIARFLLLWLVHGHIQTLSLQRSAALLQIMYLFDLRDLASQPRCVTFCKRVSAITRLYKSRDVHCPRFLRAQVCHGTTTTVLDLVSRCPHVLSYPHLNRTPPLFLPLACSCSRYLSNTLNFRHGQCKCHSPWRCRHPRGPHRRPSTIAHRRLSGHHARHCGRWRAHHASRCVPIRGLPNHLPRLPLSPLIQMLVF